MRAFHPCVLTFAAAFVSLTAGLEAQVQRTYRVVAVQGAPAPIEGADARYGIFGVNPRIGQNGHVVFGGFVSNNGGANYAIWSGQVGQIRALGTAILLIEDVTDCDGDGVESLLEEAFGTDPNTPGDVAGALPQVHHTEAEVILSYFSRQDGFFDYLVERSTDAMDWREVGLNPIRSPDQDDVPPGVERREVAVPLEVGGRVLFRVRVTRR